MSFYGNIAGIECISPRTVVTGSAKRILVPQHVCAATDSNDSDAQGGKGTTAEQNKLLGSKWKELTEDAKTVRR